jgi:HK97 family phage major capsid protein
MDEQIFKDLTGEMKNLTGRLDELPNKEQWGKTQAELADLKTKAAAVPVMQTEIDELRAALKANLGKSGADDFRHDLEMFVKAAFHVRKGLRIPEFLTKAVADYVTDVDAQGGYLVPRGVTDEVIKLVLRHGQIWPRVKKYTIPAGMQIRAPHEVTLASVTWRKPKHLSSGLGQGGISTEIDPAVVWGGDTLIPSWINGQVWIANEAMTAPGISIPQNLVEQIMAQIIRKLECGIISGYVGTATAGTGFTAPHNGLLYATNVYSQTEAATVTLALIDKFIGESIYDIEGAGDTGVYKIITTDAVAQALKGTLTQQGLDWGNVAKGAVPQLRGYEFITTPFARRAAGGTHGTAVRNHIILTPLERIAVAWSGEFRVDFNPSAGGASGQGWLSNETGLLCGTHADFTIGNPYTHSKTVFTALA